MIPTYERLAALGWSAFFQSQLEEGDSQAIPVRVCAVHRNALDVLGADFAGQVPPWAGEGEEDRATVGDWLLVESPGRPRRVLARKSLFKRRAAGTHRAIQPIAANVDTLLVVTSCNHDFNVARLERYLALAREAEVTPVVVLTKADMTDDASAYAARAARLMPGLFVECLDARAAEEVAALRLWCGPGQTVALVGSSGVGKSTLINSLIGGDVQATAGIREDDSRGRHTTTGRSMHRLAAGGWLIDTPGMRELQIVDASEGIEDVFADVADLARQCRFADCRHDGEPGCAIRSALDDGRLDPDRYARYAKLAAEDRRNSEELHERRARERSFGKMVRRSMRAKQARREP